jgi:hypothetical protein
VGCQAAGCGPLRKGEHHCARCHETFAGLGLFDKHQDVDYTRFPRVICKDPVRLGMVRAHTMAWTTPGGAEKYDRLAGMAKSRRAK